MRHALTGAAAGLAAVIFFATVFPGAADAGSRLPGNPASPTLIINMHGYRWKVPEFRMAGRKAYVVLHVVNPHDYVLTLTLHCKTGRKSIPQLSGRHFIGARQTMQLDTRRFHHRMQKGSGVKVHCVFTTNGPADVQAWVYDSRQESEIGRGMGAPNTNS